MEGKRVMLAEELWTERSFLIFADGRREIRAVAPTRDHKTRMRHNKGPPNTGGEWARIFDETLACRIAAHHCEDDVETTMGKGAGPRNRIRYQDFGILLHWIDDEEERAERGAGV